MIQTITNEVEGMGFVTLNGYKQFIRSNYFARKKYFNHLYAKKF